MSSNVLLYFLHLCFIAAAWSDPSVEEFRTKYPNPRLHPNYRGGDILYQEGESRNMVTDLANLWPYGIVPMQIDPNFNYEEYNYIMQAIGDLQRYTCVQFRWATAADTQNRLMFVKNEELCLSWMGRKGVPQELYLAPWCMGPEHRQLEITHEIIHALGFNHEQCRPDRDQYVRILWENIKPDQKFNFFVKDYYNNTMGLPYDYDSIMHYPFNSHAIDPRLTTIQVLRKEGANIGKYTHMSPLDVQKINTLYYEECRKRGYRKM